MTGTARIEGIALWAPRLPGWDTARAILRGDTSPPETPAPRPAPSMLAPTERRRAPDTVAIALEVAARACAAANREPASLASVFASTHGDLAISDYMCATLASDAPAQISPIRFHNSVHNAAAGYWTIGTGCTAASTALSAWGHTFGAGLLEALTQASCDGKPVLFVAYDIEARGPMATVTESRGLFGAALVLAPADDANGATISWRLARREGDDAPARHADLVAGNPLGASLNLFEALAADVPARVRHSISDTLALELELHPCVQR